MSDTDFEAAHAAGMAVQLRQVDIHDVPHVLVGPGSKLQCLENLLPQPTRIRAHPSFNDIDGFANYAAEFKDSGSRIFVDDSNWRFVTVFDCHSASDGPAWCDHSASLSFKRSHEWERFIDLHGKKLSPKKLAEVIEDNLDFVSAENGMTGADLLTMAQTFKVNFKGVLDVEDRLQNGLRKLIIKDESTLHGSSTSGAELAFPEKLKFNLRIFKNHSTYPIEISLRYRVSKEEVYFVFNIADTEGLEEKAFDLIIENVATETGLPTLKGKFEGPNHR